MPLMNLGRNGAFKMRLIDADALKEQLIRTDAVVMTLLGIFDIIDDASTIETADVAGKRVNGDRSL